MSQISKITQASRAARRVESGADRVPAVWRARVVHSDDQGGVWVVVPRLTGDSWHGPVQVVGDQPDTGARVLAVAVEGRKGDMVVIHPASERVDDLEAQLGGPVFDTLAAHGLALGVAENILEANLLGEVTWWHSDDMTNQSSDNVQVWPIEDHTPAGIQRAVRLEVDVLTEGLAGFELFSAAPVVDGDRPLTPTAAIDVAGDSHRYRFGLDFHVPAEAGLELRLATRPTGDPRAGRIGFTTPVITTPVERSA
ncbi:hypothetical protein [Nesterenkonia sp. HG001]|uniref:hypothetical protein n=1 Tax=Nesterenkonia sp. HG001 TaxID=2983207 RepID=UPI002AC3D3A5|nr:hypothetical protein [Nesterenkonia sp. HG001]MDZ5076728.1 hypothetical protein [Nesterenkonia sp. HG001]